MARIVEHLPVEELARWHRMAQDATEALHIQAIWLLDQGRCWMLSACWPRRCWLRRPNA